MRKLSDLHRAFILIVTIVTTVNALAHDSSSVPSSDAALIAALKAADQKQRESGCAAGTYHAYGTLCCPNGYHGVSATGCCPDGAELLPNGYCGFATRNGCPDGYYAASKFVCSLIGSNSSSYDDGSVSRGRAPVGNAPPADSPCLGRPVREHSMPVRGWIDHFERNLLPVIGYRHETQRLRNDSVLEPVNSETRRHF